MKTIHITLSIVIVFISWVHLLILAIQNIPENSGQWILFNFASMAIVIGSWLSDAPYKKQ